MISLCTQWFPYAVSIHSAADTSPALFAALVLLPPTALALLAVCKKALRGSALVLAWGFAVIITFCGGLWAFAALAATFVCTMLAGKLSGRTGHRIGAALHAKAGRRDAVQIFCNVFVGTLMLLLFACTGQRGFLWAYSGAMAASLADSMASELGVLSKAQPRDILTMKPVVKGISGGVTFLGLGASLLGAVIIAAFCAPIPGCGLMLLPDAAAAGFFAALCDSILGSVLQVKYRCPSCGALTEKKVHCDISGIPEHGLTWVTNDTVNFVNNVLGALAALGLYFLHN